MAKNQWRSRVAVVGVYAVSLVISFFLEKGPEIFESCPKNSLTATTSFLYQKAVKAGFRKPTDNYVAVVTIGKDEPDDVRTNKCLQRKFEGALVRSLERAEPAVIVFDIWFGSQTCTEKTDLEGGTSDLASAMREASRQQIPVVFGRIADDTNMLRQQDAANLRTPMLADLWAGGSC